MSKKWNDNGEGILLSDKKRIREMIRNSVKDILTEIDSNEDLDLFDLTQYDINDGNNIEVGTNEQSLIWLLISLNKLFILEKFNEESEIITENKTRYNMNKLIRLTESDLHRIVQESVQRILKETRLDYDEDNFSGRYSRNADNTIPYQGKLFAFEVDDRGKIYKYGQQPIDVISQCESEAEHYGQGHCSVETYESEEDYINAIRNYLKKGYVVTN